MSLGTRNRRRCSSCHTPDAIRLFAANTAVTSGCASSNVDNAVAASPEPNPTRATSRWSNRTFAARSAALYPASRPTPVVHSSSSITNAMRR